MQKRIVLAQREAYVRGGGWSDRRVSSLEHDAAVAYPLPSEAPSETPKIELVSPFFTDGPTLASKINELISYVNELRGRP